MKTSLFPFSISRGVASGTAPDVSSLSRGPAGADGFVRSRDGAFVTDAGEIRFSGVNLTGPGNFPSKEDAPALAEKLLRMGINCVRLHFLDPIGGYKNFMMGNGISLLDPGEDEYSFKFNPDHLDRLEFLVSEFKKRGIYFDLNLHVGRYLNRLGHYKEECITNPRLIASQRDYAVQLLNHVNPYTGLAWKDDPAMAIVEISNECSIFCSFGSETELVKKADEPFRRFLVETERRYYVEMRRFLRDDVGVKCVIGGTQLCASPAETQKGQDVILDNRYWLHPNLTDRAKWRFVDAPLSDYACKDGDPLMHMESEKTADRPFVVTEYGHPYPSSFSCETLPLLSAYAARGGWSGIFAYSYAHASCPQPDYVPFFFTIGERADVMVHQTAASLLYLGEQSGGAFDLSRVAGNPSGGYAVLKSPKVRFFTGWGRGRELDLGGGFSLSFEGLPDAFATISIAETSPGRYLVAASSSGRNTGASFPKVGTTPEEWPIYTGAGSEWGHAPILYKGVDALLRFSAPGKAASCYRLDGSGARIGEVEGGDGLFALRSEYKTLWYEVVVK